MKYDWIPFKTRKPAENQKIFVAHIGDDVANFGSYTEPMHSYWTHWIPFEGPLRPDPFMSWLRSSRVIERWRSTVCLDNPETKILINILQEAYTAGREGKE